MKSLDSMFQTVTAYQQLEALNYAIAILEHWNDLKGLTEPLQAKQKELLEQTPQLAA